MAVHAVLLVCPRRHIVLSAVYDPCPVGAASLEHLRAEWAALTARGVPACCDLCESPDLTFEAGASTFATAEEASAFLLAEGRKNLFP